MSTKNINNQNSIFILKIVDFIRFTVENFMKKTYILSLFCIYLMKEYFSYRININNDFQKVFFFKFFHFKIKNHNCEIVVKFNFTKTTKNDL